MKSITKGYKIMIKCIKTGINIYIESSKTFWRVDLFSDINGNLYTNTNDPFYADTDSASILYENDLVDGIAKSQTPITIDGKDFMLLDEPKFKDSVVEYISTMEFMTKYEEMFVSNFG